jgi:hypothetical protein
MWPLGLLLKSLPLIVRVDPKYEIKLKGNMQIHKENVLKSISIELHGKTCSNARGSCLTDSRMKFVQIRDPRGRIQQQQ